MIYTLLAGVACLTLAALWSLKKYRNVKLPGPLPLPLIGNCAILKVDGNEFYKQLLQMADKYSSESGIYGIWVGMHLVVIITGVEHAEKLLTSPSLISKSVLYENIKPWIGDGLLLSTGSKWHERRKMLTPAFHFKILDIFRNSFNKHASKLVAILRDQIDKTFDIVPFITLSSLDILCETIMGVDINAIEKSDNEYVVAVHRITNLIVTRGKYVWLWPDILFKMSPTGREHDKCLRILHSFTKKVIQERRELKRKSQISDENATKLAFLDLLLDAEEFNKLCDADIQEEVDTFMFEGHDTTSITLSWAIYLIASHNDVQEKILNEITDVVGNSQDGLTSSDLTRLKYLESVIKESLRLYPTVPLVARNVTEPIKLGNYEIPIGATLSILSTMVYRDAKYYKEPNKFDPDRWMEGSADERSPFSFIPFSAGMRNCIGQKFAMMEVKVILVWLLRAFKFSTKVKEEDIAPTFEIVLRPKNGVRIYLEERN